jgi:leucyl aminopeptidase
VLLGLRLRLWKQDGYRTTLKDEEKPSLDEVVVAGAPEGAEAAWKEAAALAEGVEFTRELVTEACQRALSRKLCGAGAGPLPIPALPSACWTRPR